MNKTCKYKGHSYDPDYSDSGNCDTPYCSWEEWYCNRCKQYIVECGCGYCNEMSDKPVSENYE